MRAFKLCLLAVILILALVSCDNKADTDIKSSSSNKEKTTTELETESSIHIDPTVTTEGIVVVSDGSYLIIEDGSPIEMHIQGKPSVLDELTSGDVIRIKRDSAVMESFPGQVNVYSIEKISDGNVYDIPAELLNTLSELGWIKERENTNEEDREIHETVTTEEVGCTYKNFSTSLRVPEGWTYTTDSEGLYGPGFTITVIPNDGEGDIKLSYTDPEYVLYDFTVPVGTTQEEYTLGGLPALRTFLSGSQYWSYISAGNDGSFMVLNGLETDTFLRLRDDVELIIGSVKIQDNGNPIE